MRGRRGNWLPRCLYAFHRRIPTTGGSFYRAVLAPPSSNDKQGTGYLYTISPPPRSNSRWSLHCLYREIDSPPCSRSVIIIGRVSYFVFVRWIKSVFVRAMILASIQRSARGGVWNYDVYSNRLNLVTLYINAIVVCPGERENCLNALKSIRI